MRRWSPFRGWHERSAGERFGWLGVTLASAVGGMCAFVVGSLEALISPNVEYGMAVYFLQGFAFLLGGFVVVAAVLAPWWPRTIGVILLILSLLLFIKLPTVAVVMGSIGLSFAAAAPSRAGDRWPQVIVLLAAVGAGWLVGSVWGGSEHGWFAGVLEAAGSR